MRVVPYSVEELLSASKQPMDVYHRELMQWAAREIVKYARKSLPSSPEPRPLGTDAVPVVSEDAGSGSGGA